MTCLQVSLQRMRIFTGFLTAVLVASFAFAGFQNENTRFTTVFVETVRLAKSRPIHLRNVHCYIPRLSLKKTSTVFG